MRFAVMYFGSVKFFKHIILTVVFGWIGVATVLAVFFAVRCHMLTEEAKAADVGVAGVAPDNLTVEEYVGQMKNAGYTSADILYAVEKADPEGFAGYTGISANSGSALPAGLPAEIIRETEAPADDPADAEDNKAGSPASEDPGKPEDMSGSEKPSGADVLSAADLANVTSLFPQLYAGKAEKTYTPDSKTVFLTFDDGPSAGTYDLLYILKKHGIKATFFMSAGKTEQCREQMAAVAEAGHTIGVHSFAHDPDKIYTSVQSFLTDFYDTYKMIYDATGVKPDIYRLPEGGDPQVLSQIRAEMDRRGFTEFPANCESGDRSADKSWQYIFDTCTANVVSMDGAAVLHLHDSADDYITVLTADDIITYLEEEGYTFAALDSSVKIDR